MNIESATYVETGIKTTVKVVADGVTMFIPIDIENKLHFKVKFNDIDIEFLYDTNYEYEREHHINGVNLAGDGNDDPLSDMLKKVFSDDVDFEYNKNVSLFSNKFIDRLMEELYMCEKKFQEEGNE